MNLFKEDPSQLYDRAFSKSNPYQIKYLQTDQIFLNSLETVAGLPSKEPNINIFKNLGFQGSNLYKAFEILKKCYSEDCTVVLAFPSNVISCGLRDLITLLCKENKIDAIITSGGGIEEDLIKTKFSFKHSDKKISDQALYDYGVNRTENIYIPNSSYVWFENFLNYCFKTHPSLLNTTPVELVKILSSQVKDPSSYLYWCYKNDISVFPVSVEDGAIGDYYACLNYNRICNNLPQATLNCVDTLRKYLEFNFKRPNKKICVLVLGGNAPKHFCMNGLIPVGGANYAIYLNLEPTLLGSNEAAGPEEAISWGKLNCKNLNVKVYGDFIFTFPLLASEMLKLPRELKKRA